MAKAASGILGGFTNKLGNIVARQRGGTLVYSVYQPNVANPNTERQQMWRYRWRVITQLGQSCLNAVNDGFRYCKSADYSQFNEFVKRNVNDVFTGSWPQLTLAYSKLVFAAGGLDLPFNPAATASETAITFTWTDNSGIGNAKSTDMANVLIYNKSQHTALFSNECAARTAATFSYIFPTAWAGDEVELYFWMNAQDTDDNRKKKDCSPSVYLGNITL